MKFAEKAVAVACLAVGGEVVMLRRRGYRWGGRVIVRCRDQHLFTTLWIPAASVKSLRVGLWRWQYCPTGRHWTWVTPVVADRLSDVEREQAAQHLDVRFP